MTTRKLRMAFSALGLGLLTGLAVVPFPANAQERELRKEVATKLAAKDIDGAIAAQEKLVALHESDARKKVDESWLHNHHAAAVHQLALMKGQKGDYESEETLRKKQIAILEGAEEKLRREGTEMRTHIETGDALSELAVFYEARDRVDDALANREKIVERAEAFNQKIGTIADVVIGEHLLTLADRYLKAGKLDLAEKSARRVLELAGMHVSQRPQEPNALRQLAIISKARGNLAEAASFYEQSLAAIDQSLKKYPEMGDLLGLKIRLGTDRAELADIYAALNRMEESQREFGRARDLLLEVVKEDPTPATDLTEMDLHLIELGDLKTMFGRFKLK